MRNRNQVSSEVLEVVRGADHSPKFNILVELKLSHDCTVKIRDETKPAFSSWLLASDGRFRRPASSKADMKP